MFDSEQVAAALRAAGIPVGEVTPADDVAAVDGMVRISDALHVQVGACELNLCEETGEGAGYRIGYLGTHHAVADLIRQVREKLGLPPGTEASTLSAAQALDEVLARLYRPDWRDALAFADGEGWPDDKPLTAGSAFTFGDVRRWAAALR